MELSAPSGFQKGGRSGEVDALLEQGKHLMMLKNNQSKMAVSLDGLLGRLVALTEEKVKEKKRTLTLKSNEVKSVRKLTVLNATVFAQVETAINEKDKVGGRVIREAQVDVQGKKSANKRWLVLSGTHIELRDPNDKKTVLRKYCLTSVQAERLPAQSLQLTTVKGSYAVVFENDTDLWLSMILEAQLRCASWCVDVVPSFRSLVLARHAAADDRYATIGHHERNSSIAAPPKQMKLASDLRHAHLAFEKVNVSYLIAKQLHETYVNDVEKRVERLESCANRRNELRAQIAALEAESGAEERLSQKAGRDLSGIFGNVLEHVGVLHSAMVETHKDLSAIPISMFSEEQSSNVGLFREVLEILDTGLTLDRPLKQQIHELERRETEAMAEVSSLEQKMEQLKATLQSMQRKRMLLESETSASGDLAAAIKSAASTISKKTEADLGRIVVFGAGVSSAASKLPGMRSSDKLGIADEMSDVLEVMGGAGGTLSEKEEVSEERDDTPGGILDRLFTQSNSELETTMLRCFEYFVNPLLMIEHLTLSYCECARASDSEAKANEIEKRMAAVRLRILNFLRKWVKIHPYHFTDVQMHRLLRNFLKCARLTGHEKLVSSIDQDMEMSAGESMKAIFDAAPAVVAYSLDIKSEFRRITDCNPLELARQLTLLDFELYCKIEHRELIKNNFMKKRSPNVANFTAHFNHIANVVACTVLTTSMDQALLLSFWIIVMRHLRALHNYQGFFAVFGGLTTSAISRLKKIWSRVDEEPYFAECKTLMDKNFSALRSELESAARPVIPYLGFYQRDLVYLEEPPTFRGTHVNLPKLVNIATTVGNCLQYQNSMYSWFLPNQGVAELIRTHRVLSEKEAHEFSLKLEPRESGPQTPSVNPLPKTPTIRVTEGKKMSATMPTSLSTSMTSGLKLSPRVAAAPADPETSPKMTDKASKLLGVTDAPASRRRSGGLSPGRKKSIGNIDDK